MTEQEAHDRLHAVLPAGSTVSLTRSLWSWSTVGRGPAEHKSSGEWFLTVMVPDHVDNVIVHSGSNLQIVVEQILQKLPDARPPKLMAPSSDPAADRKQAM